MDPNNDPVEAKIIKAPDSAVFDVFSGVNGVSYLYWRTDSSDYRDEPYKIIAEIKDDHHLIRTAIQDVLYH